jgi:hypothetical protein
MILKIPCEIKGETTTLLIRRDAINIVQSIEDGKFCLIYVDNIATPMKAKVRFQLMSQFLGRSFPEGSSKVPDDKTETIVKVGQPHERK